MAPARQPGKHSSGINIFRIAGIRISLDFSWFVIFSLLLWSLSAGYFPHIFPGQPQRIYWLAGLLATFLFFASVLIHELSHSLVAIRLGIKIPSITLFIFGGVSQMSGEAPNPKTELKIALAGPASSFVLAIIFLALRNAAAGFPIYSAVFNYLMYINFALGIFNLFPGFPLDGGRVLRAIWWWWKGSLSRATKLAADVGKGFAVFLIILGGLQILLVRGAFISGLWFIFIGIFLRSVAAGSYQELERRHALEGAKVKDIMIENVVQVNPDTHVDRLIKDYFLHYGFKGFPVSNGAPVGMVSLAGVRQVPEAEQAMRTAGEVMEPISGEMIVPPDMPLADAMRKLRAVPSERLLVIDQGRLVGLVTKTGLLRFLEIKKVLNHE
ncbi:MAG: site-2 protease family protein [Actinomycetota bacterium]|nr:site-2 protease family protein [Actinomycetota bacterium]